VTQAIVNIKQTMTDSSSTENRRWSWSRTAEDFEDQTQKDPINIQTSMQLASLLVWVVASPYPNCLRLAKGRSTLMRTQLATGWYATFIT